MGFACSRSNSRFCCLCTQLILLSSLWFAASAASCLPDQRSALLQLRQGFQFYNSDLPSWLPGTDCCRGWEGVSCDVSTGHVTAIDLSNRDIYGYLNFAIFNLTFLQYLNLAGNDFPGLIPSPGFEKLTMLTHLNLSYSGFSGQIPISIANLTNLRILDLSYNEFMELNKPNLRTLVSKLNNLRELYLDGVDVGENGTEWCGALSESVPLLQVLSMVGCDLSGPIEPSLSQLNSLSVIHLSGNYLNSPVPDCFADFPLKELQLIDCNITGFFPTKIFQIPSLTNLGLTLNINLLGTIPDFPFGNLSFLSLSGCNFSGQIPSSIINLAKLIVLDISHNALSGSIPQKLFALPNLKKVALNQNNLSGEFKIQVTSSSIWSPPLTILKLSNNQLNGSIPQEIYKLSNLKHLFLGSNQFSGPIPNSIFKLSSLVYLGLQSNKLNGSVDLSLLQNLSKLSALYLSNNQLSVVENASHEQVQLRFPKLSYLDLASCNLSQIPHFLRYCNELGELDLSNNQLHGNIPSWLWEKFNRSYFEAKLNLSGNMFTSVENVPSCSDDLSSCQRFNTIDLSNNTIKGSLPLINGAILDYSNNEFSKIPSNYTLYASGTDSLRISTNKLTGEIPSSICELDLYFLDLSINNLSGLIPSCILGAPNLKIINLASNKLHGIVPHNISKSCALLILDLSNNNLHGDLPKSLTNCWYLMFLDIGNNHITSNTFPLWLWELLNLQIISLRSNQLYGALELPPRLARNKYFFQSMRIIDLASNNLNGSLPLSFFKNLKYMANSSSNEFTTERFITNISASFSGHGIGITIINKGIQMILEKHIASMMTEIDLSNNKFTGDIPESISTLTALKALNLSRNELTGSIPGAFKSLTQMESLDLSSNSLSGEIPQELTSLDSLEVFNLSFNHLVGRIPKFHTNFDNSSFQGNLGLCGEPLSLQCNVTRSDNNSAMPMTSAGKITAVIVLCLFIGLGFGTGIAIVIVWPIIKRAIRR